MLSVEQIRNITFHRSKGVGYNATEVDQFIDDVADTVIRLDAINEEITRKLNVVVSENNELRAAGHAPAGDIKALQAELSRLKSEIAQLSAKNEEYRAYAADLRKKVVAYEAAEKERRKEIEQFI